MKHYGDYTDYELSSMDPVQLVQIIKDFQDDNFIIMSDSYKMTHHLLYPEGIEEVYSYMEPRGGDMPYTVFFGLQYYLKKYFAGVRITPDKIEEARRKNLEHFGFDCFNDSMWYHIWNEHGGLLPLEIKAVPEGTPVAIKNIILDIRNTDKKCAALTNISETMLMKLWAPNTVAAYARLVKELIYKYHAMSSDAPVWLVDFMHNDFGYRGVSSEETARILGAAALTSFKGTDTLGACTMVDKFYHMSMPGFSVIASEHSVVCAYGGPDREFASYHDIITRVKNDPKILEAKPASGVIILSLVSDTYNIYNVCHDILPKLRDEFIGWTNNQGIPIKIVIRPDSGDPSMVLFGCQLAPYDLAVKVSHHMNIDIVHAKSLIEQGIFNILFNHFGVSYNSKGFRVLNPQIGVIQGDGVSYKVIEILYDRMITEKIDIMNLVLGSGGKYLQAHDRDEQKYAIKATHVIIRGINMPIEKNPVTDAVKKSKRGYLKLVRDNHGEMSTINNEMEGFDEAVNVLRPVFRDGVILIDQTFEEIRECASISYKPI